MTFSNTRFITILWEDTGLLNESSITKTKLDCRRLMWFWGGDLVLVNSGPACCVCCTSISLCDSPSLFSVLLFCFCCCQIKKKKKRKHLIIFCLLSSVSFFLVCFLSTNFLISSTRPKPCLFQLSSSSSSPLRLAPPPRANH